MLRFLTAGESHGKGLVVILEGMPAGLHLDFDAITEQLKRRQGGYGRGRRMAIESDKAEVLSGVRAGETLGSPIALLIPNKDWENWQQTMHAEDQAPAGATGTVRPVVTRPRPGHADLAGVIKYDRTDIRDVLERASARETAARVAAGAIARQLLQRFDVEIVSHVYQVNGIGLDTPLRVTFEAARDIGSDSALRCADLGAEVDMIAEIDRCREAGDTAGGAFEVIAARPARGPRELRAMGSQARRTSCPGDDVDPRHQGCRHRHRSESGLRCRDRRCTTRSSRLRAAPNRRSAWRGRRTMPAASRAASPTAKT